MGHFKCDFGCLQVELQELQRLQAMWGLDPTIQMYGCFQKMGVPPKWMVKIMENLVKMDDLAGVFNPLFSECHPYGNFHGFPLSQNALRFRDFPFTNPMALGWDDPQNFPPHPVFVYSPGTLFPSRNSQNKKKGCFFFGHLLPFSEKDTVTVGS